LEEMQRTEANNAKYKLRNNTGRMVKGDQLAYRTRILKSFERNLKKFYRYMKSVKLLKKKYTKLRIKMDR